MESSAGGSAAGAMREDRLVLRHIYSIQTIGEVASKPRLVVIWTGLITTGGTDGDGLGLGDGLLAGTPGVGVGVVGTGLGVGVVYAAFGSHHSWNPDPSCAGARYASPVPSGAHVGCATSWLLMIVRRTPRRDPFHDATVRYETCVL